MSRRIQWGLACLLAAGLLSLWLLAPRPRSEEHFSVVLENTCRTSIYGVRLEYDLDGRQFSGLMVSPDPSLTRPFPAGEPIQVRFTRAMLPGWQEGEPFGLMLDLVLEDGTEIPLQGFWSWDAAMGREYHLVLSEDGAGCFSAAEP